MLDSQANDICCNSVLGSLRWPAANEEADSDNVERVVVGCAVENLTAPMAGRRVFVWIEDADDIGGTLDTVTSEGIRIVADSGTMVVPWSRVVAIVEMHDDGRDEPGGQ